MRERLADLLGKAQRVGAILFRALLRRQGAVLGVRLVRIKAGSGNRQPDVAERLSNPA